MIRIIKYFADKISKDNIGAYAGQAALFFLMSLIPFLLILLSLIRYSFLSEQMILDAIRAFVPEQVSVWMLSIVKEVFKNSSGVVIVSIVLSIYSAAKTIQSLRYALNTVYEIKETRNWFALRLKAMVETVVLIILIMLLMLLLMFGKRIQDLLVVHVPFLSVITGAILEMRLVILFIVLIVVFTIIYKVLPNRKATFRSQLVGAVGCSIGWYVFSFFVSIYIDYFDGFSLYGSLTTIVLIMFWLYCAMYIFLVCGEINNAFEMLVLEWKVQRARKKMRKKNKNGYGDEFLEAQKELSDAEHEIKQ